MTPYHTENTPISIPGGRVRRRSTTSSATKSTSRCSVSYAAVWWITVPTGCGISSAVEPPRQVRPNGGEVGPPKCSPTATQPMRPIA
jgi:hypothetical protein